MPCEGYRYKLGMINMLLVKRSIVILSVILVLLGVTVVPAATSVSNVEILSYLPGQTITYHGHSDQKNADIPVELSSTTSADVVNGAYSRTFDNIHVPTANNQFRVTASPVNTLSITGKLAGLPWIVAVTQSGSVSGTTGSFSFSNLPVHAYDVMVSGEAAGASSVHIDVTVTSTVTTDSNGAYTSVIDTTGLPAGIYYLKQSGTNVAEIYLGVTAPPQPPAITSTATLDLNSGWNLISLPVQPASTAITDIFTPEQQANINVIWDYNNGDWKYWTTEPGYTNQLTSLDVQKGYYVYCYGPMTVTVKGTEAAMPTMSQLHSGWNLIGYPKVSSTWIGDCYASSDLIWKYDDGSWYYWTSLDGYTSQFDVLYPGLGYWVFK